MKFVVAVVMLALAVGVNSSILAGHGWGVPGAITGWGASAPGLWGGIPGISLSQGPQGAAIAHGLWGGIPGISLSQGPQGAAIAHGLWGGIPGISLSQGPHGAAIAAPLVSHAGLGHGPGVYVAKTRGAIHTAPLDGHINSATSLNLAPAPGTL